MEKRVLVALALSFIVLGFYPLILEKFYPQSVHKSSVKTPLQNSVTSISAGSVLDKSKDVTFNSPTLSFTLNPSGGVIRKLAFPEFINSETQKPIELFSNETPNDTMFDVKVSPIVSFSEEPSEFKIVTSKETVEMSGELMASKLAVTKKLVLGSDGYSGKLHLDVRNTSANAQEFYYELSAGSAIIPRHSIDQQYIEGNFYYNHDAKNVLKHIRGTKQGKVDQSEEPVEWVAIKDRHFSVIVKPEKGSAFRGVVKGTTGRNFSVALVSDKILLLPGASVTREFTAYFGPNEIERLIPLGLDPIINFGKLDGIAKLLVGALELLHKIFRNYGLAIIALTMLINLLLFPFTRVSYMSMKRMQLIQPQINKLREQHGKNPERMNKETMELYKKHKVNPFSGCLPLVVQMPVFIALYVALSKSVILINSKLLWIHDLSSPDSVQLPMTLPYLGNQIHILPLIMVAGMVIQQKFTQVKMEGQDPAMEQQQKMMAVMMPIIFGFIFYTMPSGLVLYWLTNTIIMTLYQLHLKKVTLA